MKKSLLLAILSLFAFAASAQEKNKQIPYDWEAATHFTDQTRKPLKAKDDNNGSIYYDPDENIYLTKENFRNKYGERTLGKFDDLIYLDILKAVRKRGNQSHQKVEMGNQNYRWRLNPVNAVVGGSMIGVSLATVLVCNVQDKIRIDALKTINYVGAGVALVGTIVLISGLHKEYVPGKGLAVSNNLYLDSPAGLSLAIAF